VKSDKFVRSTTFTVVVYDK